MVLEEKLFLPSHKISKQQASKHNNNNNKNQKHTIIVKNSFIPKNNMNFSKRTISIAASMLLLASFQHESTVVIAGSDGPTSAPSELSTSTSPPSSESTADIAIETVPVVGDESCPDCYWVYGGKGEFVTCNPRRTNKLRLGVTL